MRVGRTRQTTPDLSVFVGAVAKPAIGMPNALSRLDTSGGSPLSFTRVENSIMLSWALTFLVIALIAAALGFTGIAGTATGIAQILFYVFLVLFVLSLVFGRRGRAV
jgi:uncharacterized membrane protein YtjA (UPF0391 family)